MAASNKGNWKSIIIHNSISHFQISSAFNPLFALPATIDYLPTLLFTIGSGVKLVTVILVVTAINLFFFLVLG